MLSPSHKPSYKVFSNQTAECFNSDFDDFQQSTSDTSLSQIGWKWRKLALIVVPPRRWLLMSWLSLYRAVNLESWEITSWVEWDALNPKQMWLDWAGRSPAKSSLRVMQMASALSQWLADKVEPRFWNNSIDAIVPWECVGVYTVYAVLCGQRTDCRQTASWSIFLLKIQM